MPQSRVIVAFFLSALYICTAPILDAGHTDAIDYTGSGRETLSDLSPASQARHTSIPLQDFCPACYRQASFVATFAPLVPVAHITFLTTVEPVRFPNPPVHHYFSSSSKRGPPAFS